jgi:dienelactone hydrolase
VRSILLTVGSLLLTSTCFGQTVEYGTQPDLPIVPEIGSSELKNYRMPAKRFEITLERTERLGTVVKRAVSFPSPIQKRWPTIHGNYYRPANASALRPVPAAVVVHHLGGYKPEERLAEKLAQNGVAAISIMLPNYGKRQERGTSQGFISSDPFGAFKHFQQAVKDVIRASDFLRSRREVDSSRVGVVGISLGAIVSSIAKGVDPRLRQTVLILGGGDLLGLVTSLGPVKAFMGDTSAITRALRPIVVPIDPTTFASRVNPGEVLMVNALQDQIVPRSSTDQLHDAFGAPKIHWFDCDHNGLIKHLDEVMELSLKHLSTRSPL